VATFDYNPITGQLDLVGGGASYIDGVVADSSLLPVTLGTPALDAVYLAKAGSGVWLINRKPAGLYVRVANNGVAADWTYLGAFPEVNSSANWSLYDGTTPSKELKFDLSGISASTVRTLTVPDASGTLALTSDFAAPPAIGNTTPAAISGTTGTFTTLTANTGTITASTPLAVTQTWNNSATNFRAIETNITNTNSQTESHHLACNFGGSQVASIRRDGRIIGVNVYGGSSGLESALLPQGVAVGSAAYIGFCSNSFANDTGGDLRLFRDAANTLAQRNGTNAQEFRIYNTFTSSTNYQRLTIKTKAVTLATSSGASVATTTGFIPDGAVLVGLTTRVSTAITGATGYDIGDGSDADRWGANIGFALNTASDNRDWTAGTIECFTAAQEVTLTAVGSNFTGGAVVIVAHYLAGEAD
jgi:hypothetical protein